MPTSTLILQPLPDWSSLNVPIILFPAQWHVLGLTLAALHADNEANAVTLADLKTKLGALMSTVADLKAATDQLTAADHALASEVGVLHTSVEGLVTAFDQVKGGLSQADQATLDAAVSQVVDASTDLATQTGTLTSTGADVDTANPPTPPTP